MPKRNRKVKKTPANLLAIRHGSKDKRYYAPPLWAGKPKAKKGRSRKK